MEDHSVFTILFLSNMMREKGVYTLLEACSVLKEKGLNFKCHFVGKWSDITQEMFQDKVNELALEDYVIAHGAKYGNDKNKFFSETNVFAFPSYNEAFSLVLLEAMEYGVTCISTNEGGIPEVIDNGKTGFIVDKKNPHALAEKIEVLMKNPDLCKNMGAAGRKKFLEKFTLDKFENRLKDILSEVLEYR